MINNENKDQYVKSLMLGLHILELLNDEEQPLRMSEIADRLGVGRSKAFRFAKTLKMAGYVEQDDESRKYILSKRASRLGRWLYHEDSILTYSNPILDLLAMKTNETVNLGILDGSDVYYLDSRASPHAFRLCRKAGERALAHGSALGKAIIAFLTEREFNKRFNRTDLLDRCTENTITSWAELELELDRIRAEGIAFDREELFLGLICIAAPIFRHKEVVAAISISIPTNRVDEEQIAIFTELLLKQTAGLSKIITDKLG